MKISKIIVYLFFVIQIGIIIAFWWPLSGRLMTKSTVDFFMSLGRLSGLLTVYLVLLQLLMRSRITILEKIIGFDELNAVHKKNGYLIFIVLLLHPVLLTVGYAAAGKISVLRQFLSFLIDYDDVLKACIAFLMFLGVIASSIYIVRKKLKYEFWYLIHLSTYIAIVLAWGHQLTNGADFALNAWFVYYWYGLYTVTVLCLLYWRVFRLIYINYKHTFYVKNIIRETADTFSIEIGGKKLDSFHFDAGQFAMLRFWHKKSWWESHPFSFSDVKNDRSIRFTIKKSGDFTSHIDKIRKKTPLTIDGPHGTFTLHSADKNKILCIAGGVGITPIRALVEDAARKKKKIVVIYGNKTTDGIIFKREMDSLSAKYKFPIHYVISRDPHYKGLTGRVNAHLVKRLVPDIDERDIFICGPIQMPVVLRNDLVRAGISSNQIHFERFAF